MDEYDSSIIFKTGSEESFGRIRRIFTVNNAESMFYVDVISNMADLKFSSATDTYSASDIIEKCVFYELSNRICTFCRFPNLEEYS